MIKTKVRSFFLCFYCFDNGFGLINKGHTVLHVAATADCIPLLVKHGADPNQPSSKVGSSDRKKIMITIFKTIDFFYICNFSTVKLIVFI